MSSFGGQVFTSGFHRRSIDSFCSFFSGGCCGDVGIALKSETFNKILNQFPFRRAVKIHTYYRNILLTVS